MENNFWQSGSSLVATSFDRQNIDDERLHELSSFLVGERFPRLRKDLRVGPSIPLVLQELNLGSNRIGDAGVQLLVAALLKECVELQVLKLQRNRVAAAGAQAIAIFIENVAKPPREVHLSHNFLGPPASRRLMVAAARRSEYPLSGTIPLWLRLEWQQDASLWTGFEVSDWKRWERMREMIGFAESRIYELREEKGLTGSRSNCLICCALGKDGCCSSRKCRHAQPDGTGPILHLPYIWQICVRAQDEMQQGGKTAISSATLHISGYSDVNDSLSLERSDASSSWAAYNPRKNIMGALKQEPIVVYETSQFMVLNKGPCWLCTFNSMNSKSYVEDGTRGLRIRDTQRSWKDLVSSSEPEHLDMYIAHRYNDEMANEWWDWTSLGKEGAGFVHRLDKNTSGCILRAKTKTAFEQLKNDLRRHRITKNYLCLAHGTVPPGQKIVIDDSLGADKRSNEAYIDAKNGDWAETHVRCLAHLRGPDDACYSFCEVEILSGRMHQIRVHLMHRGYPLVSDPKYNPMLIYKDECWCPRNFLHAYSLTMIEDGAKRRIVAPLADDLREAMASIRLAVDFSDGQIYSLTGMPFIAARLANPANSSEAKYTTWPKPLPKPLPKPNVQPNPKTNAAPKPKAPPPILRLAVADERSTLEAAPKSKAPPPVLRSAVVDEVADADLLPESSAMGAAVAAIELEGSFSPRAFQAIRTCVARFSIENNVVADNRLPFTLKKLRNCGLVTLAALLQAPMEQWPKSKRGENILPRKLVDMFLREADILSSEAHT